jgi:hypothetical protein
MKRTLSIYPVPTRKLNSGYLPAEYKQNPKALRQLKFPTGVPFNLRADRTLEDHWLPGVTLLFVTSCNVHCLVRPLKMYML